MIADLFEEIADMLLLEPGDHSFEVRAYQKAAMTISTLQEDVGDIIEKKGVSGLLALPGIGKTIADRINEYVKTGKIEKYEELKRKYPIDFSTLTKIEGLGAKKALKLYEALGIKNLDDLQTAVNEHRIRGLEGFGEKSEKEIAKGIEMLKSTSSRMLLGTALPEAERIVSEILKSGYAEEARIAGSTRRMRETVGDLDILIISKENNKIMDFVSSLPEVEHVVVKGDTKTTVLLKLGITCDFRVVDKGSFGSAMQYFTGSKSHNILIRQIAMKQGYKLSEYGLFNKKGKKIAGEDEKSIYNELGMDYIEPEMREARGEIELALEHRLPKLVTLEDIKGDLHTHTNHSDGANTIEEMAAAEAALGRKYIGVSDHTKSEYIARGMDDKKFIAYFKEIDDVAEKMKSKIKIFKSGEVDILKDGSLDLKDSTLEMMDYVIGAVHTNTNMDKETMTKRIVKALESGHVNILAHPTDRLINEREPISFDIDKIFEAAKENNVVMEINSFPSRLDLNDENILKAKKEYGLKFSIDTDSHRTFHLEFTRYGVGMARRGWLEKDDIVNTLNPEALIKYFKK